MDKIQSAILKKKIEANGKAVEARIISGSMSPLIKINDIIKIERAPTKLNIFDIIVFNNQEGQLTCHLFIKYSQTKNMLITRGYNNKEFDLLINREDVVGIVTNYKLSIIQKIYFSLKFIINR